MATPDPPPPKEEGGKTTWGELGLFVLLTTIGNGLNGAIFVALLKHGHSMRSAEEA